MNVNLTPCERSVAQLASQGYTDGEIAELLGKNQRTTESQLRTCYVKLGLVPSWGNPRVRLTLALARAARGEEFSGVGSVELRGADRPESAPPDSIEYIQSP
ncbi:MAG TPA: helix-turn-helix transcriptional regulator [Bryobacteraceae bacterium]|jgi:DNA-binding NarL/FixJ family response regulator|nr:helix-turn-helix transcriptional regulator [Bryobacteraceae bacterium]